MSDREECTCAGDGIERCFAQHTDSSSNPQLWTCSRPVGHDGDHMACDSFRDRHGCCAWPTDEQRAKNILEYQRELAEEASDG